MEKLIQSAKQDGADCGSDHELLIAKFRLKLKKVGKTTRPFRYGLNQIPYNDTVEMRHRFKGLDHELLTAKFRLKLKKVGKTTRPFRYDLNQILYNHTLEVRHRFKGLEEKLKAKEKRKDIPI